ncbi:MAG: c-type cytochrome domain-containing protein, partial [Verrucomicrobiota bacterium]
MNWKRGSILHSALAFVALVGLEACALVGPEQPVESDSAVRLFENLAKPVFSSRCAWCHRNRTPSGGLNLQDRNAVLTSARKFIVPGKPDESLLYTALMRENAHPNFMPGDGWSMSAKEKEALRYWILKGAPWPAGKPGEVPL